jgi:hypothetical protein
LRVPAIVHTFTRESLAARVDLRFAGDGVVRVLEGIAAKQDAPSSIRVDHGPEDRSEHLQQCDAQRIMVGLNCQSNGHRRPETGAIFKCNVHYMFLF